MQRYGSNIDDPAGRFDPAIRAFGLDAPSRSASTVGNRAVNTLATNIHERGEQGMGPDGPWDRNADSTVKRKGFDKPNFETGQMMAAEQVAGEVTVDHHQTDSAYGLDEETRAKAAFAHGVGGASGDQGQGPTGIVREFLGITDADADEVLEGVADDFMAFLARG